MPFSALAPEGPVSLLGADPDTVERLRQRNRQDACFTARCCGAPLTVRTAAGKAAHFVHKVVPAGCDGDRRETPEHERLKVLVAKSIQERREWQVDTESVERDAATRKLLWRADVLASRGRARVAFEIQLSNADYQAMRARQQRYRDSGVRGLWFVRTRKGFPASRELPVFCIEGAAGDDRVSLATAWDHPFIREVVGEAASMPIAEFVRSALAGRLQWAPFEDAPATRLRAYVDYAPADACRGCGRIEAHPLCVRARVADLASYPEFQFAHLRGFRRTSGWFRPLVDAVFAHALPPSGLTARTHQGTCCRCGTPLGQGCGKYQAGSGSLEASLRLQDLPKPRFGSVEQAWLRRWAVLGDKQAG